MLSLTSVEHETIDMKVSMPTIANQYADFWVGVDKNYSFPG